MLTGLGKVICPCENPLLILLSKENDYWRLWGMGWVFFASALGHTKLGLRLDEIPAIKASP
jgi:hypothetical protein